ncbi:MAG: Ser-Thr-rich GPI-anchored membrane family protein, partial [Candidatus Pacebacteria bacterium]|nr:Ser-Thr-rich GPI-anchored membrane family protein [Candidatus Paceibacterota bacterium]
MVKKYIFVFTAFLAIFCSLSFGVQSAKAATIEELKAQIALLIQQIAALQLRLAQLQGQTNVWCHNFNVNLKLGDSGPEVVALQTALKKENLLGSSQDASGYFGKYTFSAVVAFQEKYGAEILYPLNLKYGTGTVALATRTKLNKLYGCPAAPLPTPATTTIPVSPNINITSPNGGEKLAFGKTYAITWTSQGVSRVSIKWIKSGTPELSGAIASLENNPGTYSWAVPNEVAISNFTTGSYKIQIISRENTTVFDKSDNYFNIVNESADTVAPSVPTAFGASAVSCSQVNLSWSASTDASGIKGYYVYKGGAKLNSALITATNYSDKSLNGNSNYTYQISAVDNSNNESAKTETISITTPVCPDTTAPTIPTGFSGSVVSCSQIKISWSVSTDAGGIRGYNIYRNNLFLIQVAANSFSDLGLEGNTAYTYQISAVDNSNNESAKTSGKSLTTPACPVAPSITVATPNGGENWLVNNTYSITWNSTGTMGTVGIYLMDYTGGISKEVKTINSSISYTGSFKSYSWAIPADVPGGSYYKIEIRGSSASDASDNYFNIISSGASDTIPPTTPTSLSATPISCTQINLTWAASSDASGIKGYYVYRG